MLLFCFKDHLLPLLLVLLANDVQMNPGPSHPSPTTSRRTVTNDLKVLYLNSRSLKSFVPVDNPPRKVCKISLLQEVVFADYYEVVCICETGLNNRILDSEPLPGFNIFSQDRVGKIGGGVLIAVKECLDVTRRTDLEIDGVEVLVVQLSKANNKPVILRVFYHLPGLSSHDLELLNSSLLSNPESSCIVLVGDFNIMWSDTTSSILSILVDVRMEKLFANL